MTVNELDSRVAVVHRCFSERGDSILSVFSWAPLRAKLSLDQPGCARAHNIKPAAPRTSQVIYTTEDPTSCIQHNPR